MINIYTMTPKDRFGSNCYLVEDNGEFAVIDPSVSYIQALSKYPEIKGNVKFILLTHGHFDHILELDSWSAICERIIIGSKDAPMLKDPHKNCYLGFLGIRGGYFGKVEEAQDGDVFHLGTTTLSVIATPGHTEGSVSYKIDNATFVGDTLFAGGGYGRCDLPSGDSDALWQSIFKLFSQNMFGKFYPGHGEPDTFENSIHYFK